MDLSCFFVKYAVHPPEESEPPKDWYSDLLSEPEPELTFQPICPRWDTGDPKSKEEETSPLHCGIWLRLIGRGWTWDLSDRSQSGHIPPQTTKDQTHYHTFEPWVLQEERRRSEDLPEYEAAAQEWDEQGWELPELPSIGKIMSPRRDKRVWWFWTHINSNLREAR